MAILYRDALGYAIRDERHKLGLTMRDVAAAAPIAVSYLSEVERGQNEASSDILASIARGLYMTVGELTLKAAHLMLDWENQEFESALANKLPTELDNSIVK